LKWQNYHAVLLGVLNAQWREGFERTVIAKGKNTTQLPQEKENLPAAKGSRKHAVGDAGPELNASSREMCKLLQRHDKQDFIILGMNLR
jgi:hypothetical protein